MNLKRKIFLISGTALLLSIFVPYLLIIFTSPQYPTRSPKMYIYLDGLKGDTRDWNVVGRYIGIDTEPFLPEFEYNITITIIGVMTLLIFAAAYAGDRWKKYASVLLLSVGISMGGWAQYRFYQQGHDLDPTAPMRTIVKPFTPPLIGFTSVSKITIYHLPHLGFLLFGTATVLTLYVSYKRKV